MSTRPRPGPEHLSYIFFSEEDIEMTMTSPFFSDAPHLQYGSIVPGSFNISKWFRNVNLEFNIWTAIRSRRARHMVDHINIYHTLTPVLTRRPGEIVEPSV